MPDPHDTLSAFAQVALGLAGFSGIVIAFGRRSSGALTPLESRRLSNLFAFTGLDFILSLLGLSLLHVEAMGPSVLWRAGSAILLVTGVPWLISDWWKIHRLSPEERANVRGVVIYPFTLLAIAALALQLFNAIWWATAWAFFAGMVVQLMFAFQQFILLIHSGLTRE